MILNMDEEPGTAWTFGVERTRHAAERETHRVELNRDIWRACTVVLQGGVMCAEGMVGGAACDSFLFWDFFVVRCHSSGLSGHRLNPQITIMTVSTTRMKDSIRTL